MKRLCLFLVASLTQASHHYEMDMSFKRGQKPHDMRIDFKVNDQDVFCECGKKPVFAMFMYGSPSYYCANHIPEIEHVRRITQDDLDDLLRSLGSEMNMNGAHQGIEDESRK